MDGNGNWSLVVSLPEPGTYGVVAEALDKNGQVAGSSGTLEVTSILPIDEPTVAVTNVDTDGETADEALALSGTGTPSSQVEVLLDGAVVETVDVASNGTWRTSVAVPEIGSYEVGAQGVNSRGQVVTQPATATATRVLPIVAPSIVVEEVDLDDETDAESVTVSGLATPGSSVQVVVDGEVVDTVEADDAGSWSSAVSLLL